MNQPPAPAQPSNHQPSSLTQRAGTSNVHKKNTKKHQLIFGNICGRKLSVSKNWMSLIILIIITTSISIIIIIIIIRSFRITTPRLGVTVCGCACPCVFVWPCVPACLYVESSHSDSHWRSLFWSLNWWRCSVAAKENTSQPIRRWIRLFTHSQILVQFWQLLIN